MLCFVSTLAGFLFNSPSAEAAIPTGKHIYKIKASDAPLWDVSGTFSEPLPGGLGKMTMTIIQKSNGQISGHGKASGTSSGVNIVMNFNFAGSIKSVGSVVRIAINMPFKGTARYQGKNYPFSGKAIAKTELNENTDPVQLLGTLKITLKVPGVGSETVTGPFDLTLKKDMDGTFKVTYDLSKVGATGLRGTGTILLSNRKKYTFIVTGKYNKLSRISSIRLSDPKSKGFTLNLTQDKSGCLTQLAGSAGGQKVRSRESYQNIGSR